MTFDPSFDLQHHSSTTFLQLNVVLDEWDDSFRWNHQWIMFHSWSIIVSLQMKRSIKRCSFDGHHSSEEWCINRLIDWYRPLVKERPMNKRYIDHWSNDRLFVYSCSVIFLGSKDDKDAAQVSYLSLLIFISCHGPFHLIFLSFGPWFTMK